MLELCYYRSGDGKSPFESWFNDLDAAAAAKVSVALVRLGQGNTSNTKTVGDGVLEYRIDWGPGYRIYLGRDGDALGRTTSGGERRRQDERRRTMALTRDFKELVQKRIARDPAFGDALLREGIDAMLTGDVDTGKAILRDYIKATVGFEKLGEATGTPAKSLIRMLGPRGNPQARNLFGIIGYLQKEAGVELHVAPGPG
jgi:putative addiction module killer protein